MNTGIKLSVCVLSGMLLLALSTVGNARDKDLRSSTLKSCQERCKSDKDAAVFEACMLKCNDAEKKPKARTQG
jgi:hypothetical protein